METILIKRGRGDWTVRFGFGVQSFTLESCGTKKETQFMMRMLKICFDSYTEKIVSEYFKDL